VWIYTLFLPSFLDGNTAGLLLLQHGPFGIAALRPQALFGADLPPLLHGVLWSLSLNLLTYISLSLARQPSSIERLQADLFVPRALAPMAPTFRRWRTTVTVQDIQSTVAQYLGPDRARQAFEAFAVTQHAHLEPSAPADFELLQHAEHLIASSIGAASSRLVMSLLLRKRTVSAKAALKLLDDSHAALHFNREILQTALNHVRQGIAVFDADLQLICSNRQFGEILGLPPHLVQLGIPLREILEFMGAISPPGFGDDEALMEMRLAAYTTEGEPYLERLPDRHMVIEVRSNRMPGGGLVITFSDVTPSFEAAEARRILRKLEFHYTPKHGSWLNMAETEISILGRQCLHRRLDSVDRLRAETLAWESARNASRTPTTWRFTVSDARAKLHRLYAS